MRKIFKYPVNVGINELNMPADSTVLKLGEQNGELMLWALVDDGTGGMSRAVELGYAKVENVDVAPTYVTVYPTGVEVKLAPNLYIDTAIMSSGLVWHAFRGRDFDLSIPEESNSEE